MRRILPLALTLAIALPAAATPVGVLTEFSGAVTVLRGGKPVALKPGVPLQAGDVIKSQGGTAKVFMLAGQPKTVAAGRSVTLSAAPAAGGSVWKGVYAGLSRGFDSKGRTVALAVRPGRVLLLGPLDTAVLDSHPTLSWTPDAVDAREYDVVVQDPTGKTVWRTHTTSTSIPYAGPAGDFKWTVIPWTPGANSAAAASPDKSPEPRGLHILPPTRVTQIRRELGQINLALAASPEDRANARAALLTNYGVYGEALQELGERTNPTSLALRRSLFVQTGQGARLTELDAQSSANDKRIPLVSWDASQVPPSARKTFTAPDGSFTIDIPIRWGVVRYDLRQAVKPAPLRSATFFEFAMGDATVPRMSVAVASKKEFGKDALTPWLLALVGSVGKSGQEPAQAVTFNGAPATFFKWTFATQDTKLFGQSIEVISGDRLVSVSISAPDPKWPEYQAVASLAQTLRLPVPQVPGPPLMAPTGTAVNENMTAMQGVLDAMTEMNLARGARMSSLPASDFEALDQKRAAATLRTRERAALARRAASAAGARAWEAFKKDDMPAALDWFKRLTALKREAYENDVAFYKDALARDGQFLKTQTAQTPPLMMAGTRKILHEAMMDLQAGRLQDIQILAHEAHDSATEQWAADREMEYRQAALAASLLAEPEPLAKYKRVQQCIDALENVGGGVEARADFGLARAIYQRALALRQVLPLDVPSRNPDKSMRNISSMEQRLGNLRVAREWGERAQTALEQRRPEREAMIAAEKNEELKALYRAEYEQNLALLRNNLAILAQGQGDYAAAGTYFEKGLQNLASLPDTGLSGRIRGDARARLISNFAVLKADSGDQQGAAKLLQEAIDYYTKTGDDSGLALATLNLAGLRNEAGDNAEAKRLTAAARPLFFLQQDLTNYAVASGFLAKLEMEAKNLPQAIQYADDALAVARGNNNLDDLAAALRMSAHVRQDADTISPSDARLVDTLLREAEAADATTGDVDSQIDTAVARARYFELTGNPDAAISKLQGAVARLEAVRATAASDENFSEQKGSYKVYNQLVKLLLKQNRADEAFDYMQRARSKKLQEAIRLSNLKTPDPAVQALLDRATALESKWQQVRSQIAAEKARPATEQDAAKLANLQNILASTQAEFFAVSAEIKAKHPAFDKVLSVQPRELKKAQKALPAGALLLQYAPLDDQLYIFAVTRDSLRIYSPGAKPDDLRAKIREYRRLISAAARSATLGQPVTLAGDTALQQVSSDLYGMLIAPVKMEIDAAKLIAIIPTQELYYLPFHALSHADPTATDGVRFFIEEKPIAYLAAADVLSVVQTRDEARLGTGLLALGDPEGKALTATLPQARAEVQAIATLYPAGRALVGDRAAKDVLSEPAARKTRVIHLAAHGVLDSNRPDRSYIQLAPNEKDDGKLRVGEIYGLDLNSVDLVTLSACNTALGEGNPDGSEITSLAESFSSAGTPTVVASLWSVEDASTRQLMEAFYKELADGKPKAEALRTAQLSLLKNPKTRHPFYWAPFEVLGDWR